MTTARTLDPALIAALRYEYLRAQWDLAEARNRAEEARRQYQEAQQDDTHDRYMALMERRRQEGGRR